ncbi:hypothetical protein E2C01_009006 [Portunus trituberculatus]|uniref:Uncharacterized protein n=1 Tax=Portunus trituberculatus TaxID=210409 RepID=A0A5B7D587_PORTR|nr:hypothetical protein [Portunus trituberculatus]
MYGLIFFRDSPLHPEEAELRSILELVAATLPPSFPPSLPNLPPSPASPSAKAASSPLTQTLPSGEHTALLSGSSEALPIFHTSPGQIRIPTSRVHFLPRFHS